MSEAATNRQRLSYVEESSYGTTPLSNLIDVRNTGESLKLTTNTVASAEIRADRQIPDVIRTATSAAGDINYELSYAAHDDFFEAALQSSAWSSLLSVTESAHISILSVDNSLNNSGMAQGFVSRGFSTGNWIEIRGFSNVANNGYFKVNTVSAAKMTLVGGTLVGAAKAGTQVLKQHPFITNSTTERSFSIEKHLEDLANEYIIYKGMVIEGVSLDIKAGAVLTGAFNFIGKSEDSAAATAGAGYTTAPANEVLAATADVLKVLENYSTYPVTAINFALKNNLRLRTEVGEITPISVGSGSLNITGKLTAYFRDSTEMDKYRAGTETSLVILLEDDAGNGYIFELPKVRLTGGAQVAGGQNQDIMADIDFEAYRHPTEDVTIRIVRIAA